MDEKGRSGGRRCAAGRAAGYRLRSCGHRVPDKDRRRSDADGRGCQVHSAPMAVELCAAPARRFPVRALGPRLISGKAPPAERCRGPNRQPLLLGRGQATTRPGWLPAAAISSEEWRFPLFRPSSRNHSHSRNRSHTHSPRACYRTWRARLRECGHRLREGV